MKVLESSLKHRIVETFSLKQGDIYAFDNFIITEFNEGITVDEECFLHLYQILDIYGNNKPDFGMISNRVNSYAINTSDFIAVQSIASRKYKCAMVVYDEVTARGTLFEKQIYQCESPNFDSLAKAVSWMTGTVRLPA